MALALLLGFCVLEGWDLWHMAEFQLRRRDTERPTFNAAVYVGTYLANVLAWYLLVLHPWRWLGILSGLIVGFMILVHVIFQAVNGTGFSHHEANLVFSESQFLGSALSFFGSTFAGPAALALLLWGTFMALGRRYAFRIGGIVLLIASLVPLVSARVVMTRSFGKVFEMPVPTRIPILVDWAYRHRIPFYGERSAPQLAVTEEAWADHVVLVMDESVSGHWLGINGAIPDTTPWLSSHPRHVVNLGVASAISNLSSSSNLLLQTGLSPKDLPDSELRALREANVFAYFKKAGFRVGLIDAQSYSDRPPNLMTTFDLEALDDHLQVRAEQPELSEPEMDGAALARLRQWIGDHPRTFTYVIKNGAHLPYGDKVPRTREDPWPANPAEQEILDSLSAVRANYLRALEWSVDSFLRTLSESFEASGEEILVVYTSDHGQDIARYETSGRTPHATVVDPSSEEAAIPLILLGFGNQTRDRLSSQVPNELHASTAFSIFPTLLEMAGYNRSDATRGRMPSLFEANENERVFASGNVFAREGGFYVLNPGYGDAMHIHPFESPETHQP